MSQFLWMRVLDKPGILDRVTGLIRRNGVNIKTITSGNTSEGISQITISLENHARLDVLGERLGEMAGVVEWEKCTQKTHLMAELVLARFGADQKHLITERMTVVREENGMTFVQFAADPMSTDMLLSMLLENGVECARGGAVGLPVTGGQPE